MFLRAIHYSAFKHTLLYFCGVVVTVIIYVSIYQDMYLVKNIVSTVPHNYKLGCT